MEDKVFRLPTVVEEFKARFVEARLHTDGDDQALAGSHRKLLREMVGGIANPSYAIVDPRTGKTLATQQGWLPDETRMLAFLRR